VISLRDVAVHYPRRRTLRHWLGRVPAGVIRALDGVDLDVARGEIVALVGESGSGKTTTGRALVRLAPITSGRVLLDDRDVTRLSGRALRDYRRRVQIIFQDPYESLDPRRSIGDQVTEPLAVQGIGTGEERRSRVDAALEDAGLRPAAAYRDRFPHELSGGQRQRVAIATAMVLDPDVLVADEPVSMLDVSIRSGILRVMLDLRRDRGVGILFITHDLSLAWLIADRIAVMYLGRIVEIGPAEQLVGDPRHPYTRALLSVMPSPDPRRRRARQILVGETPDAGRIPAGCRFHTRCPLVFDRCRVDAPPPVPVGPDHTAACWLAVEPAPTAEPIAAAELDHPRADPAQPAAEPDPTPVEPA
jgi:oligopeptide/dipeptide ABC transporter ATP-binding protein